MASGDADRSGVRVDGPQSHLSKAGTPTMGGALIIVAIASGTLLWGDLTSKYLGWLSSLRCIWCDRLGGRLSKGR